MTRACAPRPWKLVEANRAPSSGAAVKWGLEIRALSRDIPAELEMIAHAGTANSDNKVFLLFGNQPAGNPVPGVARRIALHVIRFRVDDRVPTDWPYASLNVKLMTRSTVRMARHRLPRVASAIETRPSLSSRR